MIPTIKILNTKTHFLPIFFIVIVKNLLRNEHTTFMNFKKEHKKQISLKKTLI